MIKNKIQAKPRLTFAMLDHMHLLDGLFVPQATEGQALYRVAATVVDGGKEIAVRFKGVQLSATHQSVLLALAALASESVRVVPGSDAALAPLCAGGTALEQNSVIITTTRYRLLQVAGMTNTRDNYARLTTILSELSTIIVEASTAAEIKTRILNDSTEAQSDTIEKRQVSADFSTSNLISRVAGTGDDITVALNWRLTRAIFGGRHAQVSLVERGLISAKSVTKILHSWLSSCVALGGSLGSGTGAHLEKLIQHVYGNRKCSDKEQEHRRARIKDSLNDLTLLGWLVRYDDKIVHIGRPLNLPNYEKTKLALDAKNAEHYAMDQIADLF